MRIFRIMIALVIVLIPALLRADSHGPNSPSAYTDGGNWSSQTNAYAQDDAYAVYNGSNNADRRFRLTGFGFNLPGCAIIDSIVVELDTYRNPGIICTISVTKEGTTEISSGQGTCPTSDNDVYQNDGAQPLWGTTWSAADINSANFGIIMHTRSDCSSTNWRVDHVRVTVFYSSPPNTVQKRRIRLHSED